MSLRRIIFWCHLATGLFIGLVLVFLATTGAILSTQDPVVHLVERSIAQPVHEGSCRTPSEVLREARKETGRPGASLTLYSDAQPALFTVKADTVYLVDACTGSMLQAGPSRVRAFFSAVKDLHRWVALAGVRHETLRSIKDAANLGFSFLILSGIFLWLPRRWTRARLRSAVLVRPGFHGRAREWNLHTVVGFWFAVPLLTISLTGSVMAYAWANDLLYSFAGDKVPRAAKEGPVGSPALDLGYLDPLVVIAQKQDSYWRQMTVRLPRAADKSVSFTIDDALDNAPSHRNLLTVSRAGKVVRWEPFQSLSRGRRWRLDVRFLHSGDLLGVPGRVVVGLSTLALLLLIWTGFSLGLRRASVWRRRRSSRYDRKSALSAV